MFPEEYANNSLGFLKAVFVGVTLTATSVSITVETLREMGKLNSNVGNALLGAAIIDDILGIIALSVVSSFADTSVQVSVILLKIVLYFVVMAVVSFVLYKILKNWFMDKENFKRQISGDIQYCETIEDTLRDTELCFIFTEWEEVKKLDTRSFEKYMKTPIILDGRNCYDMEAFNGMKVIYDSIGRPCVNNLKKEN